VFVAGDGIVAYSASTGAQLWVTSNPGGNLTVSPDGSKVFVTGTSLGSTSGLDYATAAYSIT
jgi:hypothetical protein